MSKQWVDEMRSRLRERLADNTPKVAPRNLKKPAPKQQSMLLILTAFALGLGVLVLFSLTHGDTSPRVITPSGQIAPAGGEVATVDGLQKKLDGVQTKVALLGAMHNNNWRALAEGQSTDNLVFIERDWKMSKMLPALEIPQGEQSFFQQWTAQH